MKDSSPTTTQIRAEKADAKRMDQIAPKLEAKQGGTWSRPQVLKAALDALESKLAAELLENTAPMWMADSRPLLAEIARLSEEVATLRAAHEATRGALKALVDDVDELINESHGVYGLHQNGDVAPWGELTGDGRFGSWLQSLEIARTQGGATK